MRRINIFIFFCYLVILLLITLYNIYKFLEEKNIYNYYIILNKTFTEYETKHYSAYNEDYLRLPKIIEYSVLNNINNILYRPKVVIAVLSSPQNFKKRFSFRKISKEYCNKANLCKFIFFIGYSEIQKSFIKKKEMKIYDDVVQFSFQNSYFNLTLLSIMALKYCFRRFKHLIFYIKTDDDILINYSLLFITLNRIDKYSTKIYGHFNGKFKVNRNNISKTYIPNFQYPYKYCPEYVYGGLIIITYSSLSILYNATLNENIYIWKEDVNLGVLCKKYNVTVLQYPNKVNLRIQSNDCKMNERSIAVEIYNKFDNFYCIN